MSASLSQPGRGCCFSSVGLHSTTAGAAMVLLACLSARVAIAQTRSRSFEGTWVADKQIVVIEREGDGLQTKSMSLTGSGSLKGRRTQPPVWVYWGRGRRVGNTVTYQFRRALPEVAGGSDIKTTQLTLSTDGQSIVAVSYYQLTAFGNKGQKDHLVRVRMRRKSS